MNIQSSEIAAKLVMMQLADSFFPSGSFSLSHGLEFLIQKNSIQSDRELFIFLQLLIQNLVVRLKKKNDINCRSNKMDKKGKTKQLAN